MPSRRQLLAAGGGLLATAAAGGYAGEQAIPIGAVEWPMPRQDPAGTGATDQSGPKRPPTVRWQAASGIHAAGPAPPVLFDDVAMMAADRTLVAVDRSDGTVLYERDGPYQSVVVAEADAYRSDALVGQTPEGFLGLSADGGFKLAGWSIGVERWFAPGRRPASFFPLSAARSTAVPADGRVYGAVPESNRLVAIDANNGRVEWESRLSEQFREMNRPAVRDGTVYATNRVGAVIAVDAETGDRRWKHTLEPFADDGRRFTASNAPAATHAGLVVPSSQGVDLLDAADGSRRWRYTHEGSARRGTAAVADGRVILSDGNRFLHGIDLTDGERLWTWEHGLQTDPIVADGVVYLSYHGLTDLWALDAETGEELWRIDVPSGPSQPVVGDGALYLSTFEGIIALEGER